MSIYLTTHIPAHIAITARIVECARSYIGTRFLHQGRLGKSAQNRGGLDCLGLLICVARDCALRSKNGELLAELDEFNYPHYPDEARLFGMLSEHLNQVSWIRDRGSGIKYQEADIALFEINGRVQHMGIITPATSNQQPATYNLIHAYAPARAVVEHALDDYWQKKIVAVFRV